MATTETILIKQLLLAEDISWGLIPETQVRNGVTVTGFQVNTDSLLFNKPGNAWHGYSVTDILEAIIAQTGIAPQGA